MNSKIKSGLSAKLQETETFIHKFVAREGRTPTLEEIREGLNLNWISSAQKRVDALVKNNRLRKQRGGLAVESESSGIASLPLLGYVAAGKPIEALELPDFVEVPRSMIRSGKDYFCLKVKGDSMMNDHILDGDIVLIQRQNVATNGETIVALVDGNATLKKFYKNKTHIELRPSHPKMKPIQVDPEMQQFKIAGVYAGLIRRPH